MSIILAAQCYNNSDSQGKWEQEMWSQVTSSSGMANPSQTLTPFHPGLATIYMSQVIMHILSLHLVCRKLGTEINSSKCQTLVLHHLMLSWLMI